MKLPRAFSHKRVNEALASLAIHVTSAREIAASLRPIKTAALDLQAEEKPRPIITSIEPTTNEAASGRVFTIRGKNFAYNSVQSFELFLEDDPSFSFPAVLPLVPIQEGSITTGFKACVNLAGAPSGSYEVRIKDENDTPHLPGFTVGITPKSSTSDSSSSSSSSSSSPSSSSSSPSSSSSSPYSSPSSSSSSSYKPPGKSPKIGG
jgi:hypothetical protein